MAAGGANGAGDRREDHHRRAAARGEKMIAVGWASGRARREDYRRRVGERPGSFGSVRSVSVGFCSVQSVSFDFGPVSVRFVLDSENLL